jgi:methylmalonyl-CoA mutase
LNGLEYLGTAPGEFPYTRGTKTTNEWSICAEEAKHTREGLIEAYRLQDNGANVVQELGFAIAEAAEAMATKTEAGLTAAEAASKISFAFGVGSNYFFEIAKFRAARLLWSRVAASFNLPDPEAAKAKIHARTSRWNKTVYDPYVNVLRSTTEAMSAAIGGADSICVAPFDETYREPDELSERLARNTQIILQKEAYLDRVADPAAGSYYVESLTDAIAKQAWKLFQQVEGMGGYNKASGFIKEELAKSQKAKVAAIASRRTAILGTNQYPNLKEKMLAEYKRPLEGVKRGAVVFETIRLRTERHAAAGGKIPKFLLAEIGNLKMRKARSGFATNFFGCGGFEIVTRAFADVDEAAKAAEEWQADVVVLCSSDEEYSTLAGPLCGKVKVPVIVAGYPKDTIEQLKKDGVADFVHVRTNAAESLADWQQKLGVKE